MIRVALVLGAIIAISLVTLSFQPRTAFVEVTCNDFLEHGNRVTKEVELDMWKDFIEVTLCSNPTTGFKWSIVEASYDKLWAPFQPNFEPPEWTPISHKFEPPEDREVVGASGQEVWTLATGNGTITMEYSQPWEGGEKAERTFILSVTR